MVDVYLQADVDEEKIKHFQKLKELPQMQLRQVCEQLSTQKDGFN